MSFATIKFSLILWGLSVLLKYSAWRYPVFRARLKERNLVAQIKARDEEIGRERGKRCRIATGATLAASWAQLLVSFDSEVRKRGYRSMMRTSESGH